MGRPRGARWRPSRGRNCGRLRLRAAALAAVPIGDLFGHANARVLGHLRRLLELVGGLASGRPGDIDVNLGI